MRRLVAFVLIHYTFFASLANAANLSANFDSFPEGAIGTEFTDGGITFSDLDIALSGGPYRFIIENATFPNPMQYETAPNILTFSGHSPGPSYGIGRFRSMTVAFPGSATSANMDVFTSRSNNDKILKLTAFLDDVAVATTSIMLPQGTMVNSAFVHHSLGVNAASFNKLKFLATTPSGIPDFTTIAFDNVQVDTIPEPGPLLLLLSGSVGALVRRHRRFVSH